MPTDSVLVMSRRALIVAAAFGCLLLISGWASPWIAPDTQSYLGPAPYPNFYFAPRLPFYGWLVAEIDGVSEYLLLVYLQLAIHVFSAWAIFASSQRIGMNRAAAWSLFLAALASQNFLIWGRAVVPEALGMSFALLAFSATLMATTDRYFTAWLCAIAVSSGGAIFFRPTYLPLPFVLPILYSAIRKVMLRKVRVLNLFALLVAGLTMTSIYVADRARHTNDINLVAFGGFAMSGMSGLMLDAEIVDALPQEYRELAASVLRVREVAEAQGHVIATPLNSSGQRSFFSAAAGYFDIYARTYDNLVFGGIYGLKKPDESFVDFDRRLRQLSIEVLLLSPVSYAGWLVGATSRLAGRMMVTNVPFVLATIVFFICFIRRVFFYRSALPSCDGGRDLFLLISIVLAYIAASVPLIVLVTFPASRYIDAAAVLLPAIPLYGAIRLYHG